MKITTINTIELSSLCNNKCQYCPAKDQGDWRDVGFMDVEVFEKALSWVKHYCNQGTQLELNLFGVGESTMHPRVVEFVELARNTLPIRQILHLNTNGKLITRELARKLRDAGITQIDITGHDAYVTARTIKIFKEVGIIGRLSFDFITQPNDWAGQVDWFPPDYSYPCPWLKRGQAMVMSNGDITRCCIDAFARGVMGTVFDDLTEMDVTPFELCKSCHQTI